ncbi:MAG: hypothetical protein EAZ51_08165 [Sphingobacteriales bacterium]|nr:MAG: hypothetical protein EAZ64_08550 [Sphingobacteriales bacterium]TAF79173.1 MAG: hypothetical protein EAZ51_08165 [Sphingobacteriales bacterium]
MRFLKAFFTLILTTIIGFTFAQSEVKTPQLVLVNQTPEPVISVRSIGAERIKWGFEGGRVVKIGKTYHLFTSEMIDNPIWTKMKLGYWISTDGLNWTRKATLKQGTGDFTGKDERAALWSPLPVFDKANNRWNLFYVAYKSAPSLPTNFLGNHAGRVWRSVSAVAGINGIGGPYIDKAIVLKPGKDSGSWEGLQGTDSFFPYQVGETWYAFYGSAQTEFKPVKSFLVGMANSTSASIAGPWIRLPKLSPSKLETYFIENPIVTPAPGGGYLCVYDSVGDDAIGWAYSNDGLNWGKGNRLIIQPNAGKWAKDVRTPLGLVYEGDNKFTLYYTGFEESPNWTRLLKGQGKETCAIGKVELFFFTK